MELIPSTSTLPGYWLLSDGSVCPENLYEQRYSRLRNGQSKVNLSDMRTATEKDRDRIAYSTYFQRLAGVTQVVSPHLEAVHLHNRQAHSYKVALVSRSIATDILRKAMGNSETLHDLLRLGGLDVAACEAAGLAHDIGHPPFGHVAEPYLTKFLCDGGVSDGFEGNAQSLRVVTLLDRRTPTSEPGLDLTAVTLRAILKYPWTRVLDDEKRDEKYGVYQQGTGDTGEPDLLTFSASALPDGYISERQSVEAAIMDLADDITYAMHDLEDFYFAGILAVDDVLLELADAKRHMSSNGSYDSLNPFVTHAGKLASHYQGFYSKYAYEDALGRAEGKIGNLKRQLTGRGSPASIGTVRQWVGDQIELYLKAIRLVVRPPWDGAPPVHMDAREWHEMQVMKTISKGFVVQTPKVGLHERSQLGVLGGLVEQLSIWVLSKDIGVRGYPEPLRSFLKDCGDDAQRRRAIADYICTLSDSECVRLTRTFNGVELSRYW